MSLLVEYLLYLVHAGSTKLLLYKVLYVYGIGVMTLTITNPIWVAKTRMCLNYGTSTRGGGQYTTLAGTLSAIWRQEGVRGLYKVT